ncbi:MAG TPA: beta-galactosidase domain 4-containing protein, partial [Draconibacterium sp.]|nr:beta-galactosidase domain 4-containing protein [Draconibacterium sp.]
MNQLGGIWQIKVDGEPSQRGFFDCDIPAGESGEITIDYRKPRIDSKTECLLEVSFVLKDDLNWAPKGHEVAWEQFPVPADFYFVQDIENENQIKAVEDDRFIRIEGVDFSYSIDKNTGQFVTLEYNNSEYLESGPEFKIWRAPLANDIDEWGANMYARSNQTPGLGRSIDNKIRTLGMRNLVPEVEELELIQVHDDEVTLKMDVFANSTLDPARRKDQWFMYSAFEQKQIWKFKADGTIELEQEIIPHGPMPDVLPKVGLQFQLPKSFNHVQWYGRGPFENYPDRKTGAKVGLYQSTADSMYVPYIIPQDYGNRSDVRWLKVQNENEQGLLIQGDQLLNFSLHKYATNNLSRAMYTYQLEEAPNTILNVDYEVSGVGGTAIRQLQKYRVRPDVKKYTLMIKPF